MDKTENLLRALFDFQRFAGNERLDGLIRAAGDGNAGNMGFGGAGAGVPLEDDDMELNAAGEADAWRVRTGERKKP